MDKDKAKPSTSKQYRSKPNKNKHIHVEQDWPAFLEILNGENSDGDLSDLSGEEIENNNAPPFMQRLDFLNRKRVGADKMGRDDGDLGVEESVEVDIYSKVTPKESIRWKRKSLVWSIEEYTAPDLEEPELQSPVHYFKRYVPDELFSTTETNTNIYALQQGRSSFKQYNSWNTKIPQNTYVLGNSPKSQCVSREHVMG
jgi:hypothetical protein